MTISSSRRVLMRLVSFFRRGEAERQLAREMASHLALLEEEFRRRGMTADDARVAARRAFGGVEQAKEHHRDARSFAWLEDARRDVGYALRTLRRTPGFTAVGIVTLALGIGANTAVFSVVNAVILNPLPYTDPDRIVTFSYTSDRSGPDAAFSKQVSVPDFQDWRNENTVFDAMAYYATRRTSVMSGPAAEYAVVARSTEEFFRVLAVQPVAGRFFTREEEREGGAGAVMVGYAYARQHFGEPFRALGQTLRMFGRSVPVVGVLPPGFDFPAHAEIWFPARTLPDPTRTYRSAQNYRAIGRIKSTVRLEQAQAELTGIAARLERLYPDSNRNRGVRLTPLRNEMIGDVQLMLYLLLGAVGFVLLIACATMATLLLAKATARAPEMAIRSALGASRSRVVRQLLVEAFAQSLMAGALGACVAVWGTKALIALAPANVPRLAEAAVNGQVLAFTFGICVVVSLLFGLPPALQAARVDLGDPLRHSSRASAGSRGGTMREALVIVEIALSVVLLVAGGLLVRSLIALQNVSLGFRPESVLVMEATLPAPGPDGRRANEFFQGLLGDVSALPGVVAAGATMAPPGTVESESAYWLDRMPAESPGGTARAAVMSVIAPGTFGALGIPLRSGRDFQQGDVRGTPPAAIINEALAREAFHDRDPIGRAIVCGFDSMAPMTIVGVVGDVRQYGPARASMPECYMPYLQHNFNNTTLNVVVRTAGDPIGLADAVQRKARVRSPEVSVRVTTMDARLAAAVATPKFRALLLSLFAAIALCLTIAGVYGVTSYVVGQRSREIGLRMALGATTGGVMWLLLRRGLTLAAIGLALGSLGAAGATRLLAGMLFEVRPSDIATYLGAIGLLGVLSLLATYIPARRSAAIDPVVALRQE